MRLLRLYTWAATLCVLLPLVLMVAASFTTARYVSFPPQGFTLHWFNEALSRPDYVDSFLLSLVVAAVTGAIATALGTLAAIALVRFQFRFRAAVDALILSPLLMPQVVIGIALLQAVSLVGLAPSAWLLVAGHVVVAVPFAVRMAATSLRGIDPAFERAARSLGASPARAWMETTLPLIRPGLLAAFLFTFITSFDDLTISVFLASPTLVTLPVRIFNELENPVEPWLLAVCTLVILWTGLLIVVIERLVGVGGLYGQRRPA